MDSMEHADCASKRGTLLFSYAAPEQLKQARLEVVQERVRERLARAAAARIQADPLQGLETEALWQDDTATLDVSPLPDSCVALPPSGLDQYQQLVVPPAVNKSGEARMMTAKLVNKGKVDTYRQGTRDPSQPETLAIPVAYDLKTMEQIEAAEIAAAAAAARSNRRSSSVSSRSSGAALLAAAASTRSPSRTSAARHSADKAAAEGGAAKPWVDPLLSSLKASVQVPFVPVPLHGLPIPPKGLSCPSRVILAVRSSVGDGLVLPLHHAPTYSLNSRTLPPSDPTPGARPGGLLAAGHGGLPGGQGMVKRTSYQGGRDLGDLGSQGQGGGVTRSDMPLIKVDEEDLQAAYRAASEAKLRAAEARLAQASRALQAGGSASASSRSLRRGASARASRSPPRQGLPGPAAAAQSGPAPGTRAWSAAKEKEAGETLAVVSRAVVDAVAAAMAAGTLGLVEGAAAMGGLKPPPPTLSPAPTSVGGAMVSGAPSTAAVAGPVVAAAAAGPTSGPLAAPSSALLHSPRPSVAPGPDLTPGSWEAAGPPATLGRLPSGALPTHTLHNQLPAADLLPGAAPLADHQLEQHTHQLDPPAPPAAPPGQPPPAGSQALQALPQPLSLPGSGRHQGHDPVHLPWQKAQGGVSESAPAPLLPPVAPLPEAQGLDPAAASGQLPVQVHTNALAPPSQGHTPTELQPPPQLLLSHPQAPPQQASIQSAQQQQQQQQQQRQDQQQQQARQQEQHDQQQQAYRAGAMPLDMTQQYLLPLPLAPALQPASTLTAAPNSNPNTAAAALPSASHPPPSTPPPQPRTRPASATPDLPASSSRPRLHSAPPRAAAASAPAHPPHPPPMPTQPTPTTFLTALYTQSMPRHSAAPAPTTSLGLEAQSGFASYRAGRQPGAPRAAGVGGAEAEARGNPEGHGMGGAGLVPAPGSNRVSLGGQQAAAAAAVVLTRKTSSRDRHGPLAWRGHISASGVADPFPPASSPGALSPGAALSSLLSPRLFQHYPGFSSFTASDGLKSPASLASALRASVSARPGSAVWRGNADVGTIGFAAGPPPRPGAASHAAGHGSITVLQPAAQVQAMLALPHSLPGGMPGPARPARPNTAGPRSNGAGVPSRRQRPPSAGAWSRSLVRG
ncbi:hypothetical protein QJQ45_001846 [Haematococcus lacustris]|nr:hypothetical protein QJQ45_001846 [Haematococcus lacustris]